MLVEQQFEKHISMSLKSVYLLYRIFVPFSREQTFEGGIFFIWQKSTIVLKMENNILEKLKLSATISREML